MTDQQPTPPPLPRSQTAAEWFIVKNGTRHGPLTAAVISSMLERKEVGTDAQVWRTGMSEWKPIRESDLSDLVATEPPPISSSQIGNSYVWTLAVVPLLIGLIEATLEANNASRGLPLQLPALVGALLGWLDYRLLEKAGYKSWGLRAAAVLLTPVYLFMRAKRLKQRPTYAICWLVSFAVGLLIYGSVTAQ